MITQRFICSSNRVEYRGVLFQGPLGAGDVVAVVDIISRTDRGWFSFRMVLYP